MKIKIVSDLHLEFGPLSIENNGADVLILSGDICVASDLNDRDNYNIMGEQRRSNSYHTFFSECCERFSHVIYIAGNHEHYHGDFATSISRLREKLSYLSNLYILDKEVKVIDDVTFVGGTLWTDMNKEDPNTLFGISRMMNDFRLVENSNREVSYKVYGTINGVEDRSKVSFKTRPSRFGPEDALADHKEMMQFVKTVVEGQPDQKFVVVGHHAPSKQSTKPRYKNDVIMNGGYSSDLSEFILDNPQIKLWTHGHTHDTFDYMIGSTRIVCNPRGYYGYEENPSFDPGILVEV